MVSHWCVPAGSVNGSPPDLNQICKDRAIGAPTNPRRFDSTVEIGIAETANQQWRIAFGATESFGINQSPDTLGLEAPIYLNFSPGSAMTDYGGSYKGILRITPRFTWTKGEGAMPAQRAVVLTVEVLAQDSMIGDVLDF